MDRTLKYFGLNDMETRTREGSLSITLLSLEERLNTALRANKNTDNFFKALYVVRFFKHKLMDKMIKRAENTKHSCDRSKFTNN